MNNAKKPKKGGLPARNSFNAFDIAIILLILVCIVGIYMRFDRETKITSGDGEKYSVEFVCEKVRSTTGDYVRGDLEIFLSGSQVKLGVLGQTVVMPYTEEKLINGTLTSVHYPSWFNIYSSFEVNGVMTENGFLIGGDTYIAPNSVINISAKTVDMTVRILSIKKVESE